MKSLRLDRIQQDIMYKWDNRLIKGYFFVCGEVVSFTANRMSSIEQAVVKAKEEHWLKKGEVEGMDMD